MGKGLLKGDISRSGNLPAIPYTSLYTDFSEVVEQRKIKWFTKAWNAPYVVNTPCLLFASSSNVSANTGKACALIDGFPVAVGREVITLATNENVVFISYLLGTRTYRKKTLDLARGITIKHVYPTTFVDYTIILPPPLEQTAIATALSDVDALLAALDALITKQRDIKQGAMQELLTGKRRLAGFEEEWEVKRLVELCSLKSGATITAARIDSHSAFPCYGGNGLRGYTKSFTHKGNYALIGRQGALCGNVVYVTDQFFASEHALVVTPKLQTDIRWLVYILVRANLNQYSESSAQPGLSASKLLQFEFSVPPTKQEQAAIAQVLSDMDSNIEKLEAKRTKIALLKQGMMQELLTGRIRLLDEAA